LGDTFGDIFYVAEVAVGPLGHHIEYSTRCASVACRQLAWTILVHTPNFLLSSTLDLPAPSLFNTSVVTQWLPQCVHFCAQLK